MPYLPSAEPGAHGRTRLDSPPPALELDLLGRHAEHGDLDIWRAESSLDVRAAGDQPRPSRTPYLKPMREGTPDGSPRLDGIQPHLDTRLGARGVHDQIDRALPAHRRTRLQQQVFSGPERVRGPQLSLVLLRLRVSIG